MVSQLLPVWSRVKKEGALSNERMCAQHISCAVGASKNWPVWISGQLCDQRKLWSGFRVKSNSALTGNVTLSCANGGYSGTTPSKIPGSAYELRLLCLKMATALPSPVEVQKHFVNISSQNNFGLRLRDVFRHEGLIQKLLSVHFFVRRFKFRKARDSQYCMDGELVLSEAQRWSREQLQSLNSEEMEKKAERILRWLPEGASEDESSTLKELSGAISKYTVSMRSVYFIWRAEVSFSNISMRSLWFHCRSRFSFRTVS